MYCWRGSCETQEVLMWCVNNPENLSIFTLSPALPPHPILEDCKGQSGGRAGLPKKSRDLDGY